MQLCSSNIKNFLIFSYILRKGTTKNVFIFKEMETLISCLYFKKWNFSAQAKKKLKKICSEENFSYFKKRKHQKNSLYFLKRKQFLYFGKQPKKIKLLCFTRNFQSPKNQNFLHFCKKDHE